MQQTLYCEVRSSEHIGIVPLSTKMVQPNEESTVFHHF